MWTDQLLLSLKLLQTFLVFALQLSAFLICHLACLIGTLPPSGPHLHLSYLPYLVDTTNGITFDYHRS